MPRERRARFGADVRVTPAPEPRLHICGEHRFAMRRRWRGFHDRRRRRRRRFHRRMTRCQECARSWNNYFPKRFLHYASTRVQEHWLTRKASYIVTLAIIFAVACVCALRSPAQSKHKTENVVLIVIDGVRWQEIFTGADESLLNKDHGGSWQSEESLRKRYWRSTPEERREILVPFLWKVVAKRGQIFGNRDKGSGAHVTNGRAFSYPGYNEMLTGAPDDKIDSNEFGPNPNTTVFEWLNRQPEFHGKVSVFGTWDTFRDIFNQAR